jgi:6-phosphofructokinase 2
MQKIVTLTLNPAVDISTSTESVASEIKLRCAAPDFDPGGGGINVSRAIKKLGGESLAIFTSGGHSGKMLETLLQREALTMQPIVVSGGTRENFTVFEQTTTLQYRFNMPGAPLSDDELQRCTDAALNSGADYLVASGSLTPGAPVDYFAQLTLAARAKGMRVIVDTSGAALAAMQAADAYLLKPNIGELETFSGEKFQGEAQLQRTGQRLIADNLADVLVVSLGAGGAALVTAEGLVQFRPPVVPIQSKVGAGDSMVGGIVLALAQGKSLEEAVRRGVAAGSAAVMNPGTDLCRKDDADAIYDQIAVVR